MEPVSLRLDIYISLPIEGPEGQLFLSEFWLFAACVAVNVFRETGRPLLIQLQLKGK